MNNYCINKTVPFKFRGIDLKFDLSPGLFSSAGVDTGTKLLLKVFSRILDEDAAGGMSPPMRVLDSGCGTGVIGICAAAALSAALPQDDNGLLVRCQDRDELARLITLCNAAHNGIPPSALEAYTEPLLAGPPDHYPTTYKWSGLEVVGQGGWDLIFTNIPAKTGTPVLEDFVRRSAAMLNPGGRVIMVAVNTLADFFRERIAAEAELEREEKGSGHTVFVFRSNSQLHTKAQRHKGRRENPISLRASVPSCEEIGTNVCDSTEYPADFFIRYPFYIRTSVTCPIENIPVHLETIHGAGGFDSPGGAVLAAAKLAANLIKSGRMKLQFPLLIHEPGQGFFPCWLLEFLRGTGGQAPGPLVLSGRNILALEATRHNIKRNNGIAATIVPVADLSLGETALCEITGGQQYGCIIAFPELLPSILPKAAKERQGSDQLTVLWNALPSLLSENGIFLAAFGSSDAERFDRKKPAGFSRLGSIKRDGFRALAYRNILLTKTLK